MLLSFQSRHATIGIFLLKQDNDTFQIDHFMRVQKGNDFAWEYQGN